MIDNLKANAVIKNTNANICKELPSSRAGNSAKLMVPVAPYSKEIPNNKIPVEKADDRIIFMAASEEIFFSRSKLAIAARGMVASSNDKKNIKKLPLEIRKSKPSKADNINIKNSGKCWVFLNQPANNKEIR